MAELRRPLERLVELVKFDLIRVCLRRVRARMPHQTLKRDEVASALADEAICEAVPKLVRGEESHAGTPAHALHHPPQRLLTGRCLRVLPPADPLVLGGPELNLHREDVVTVLRLEFIAAAPKLARHVRIERQPVPVTALPLDAGSLAIKVEVVPGASEDL